MTPLIACVHYYWIPAANPYREVQAIVLLLLVAGACGWRRVRPKPSGLVIGYGLGGSAVTLFGTCAQTCGDFDSPAAVCGVVLQASIVLTLCVYVEIIRALRAARIAKATAKYRASSSCA